MSARAALNILIAGLDQAYNRQSWHGTNLRGSLRGVTFRQAARRPRPGRHNILELVVHAAYWKYTVLRRLTGQKRGSFPLDGSNFFRRPTGAIEMTDRAWRADIALLDRMHRDLRAAIVALPPSRLHAKAKGAKTTNAFLIQGIAAHDLYHAGQIQLLKRLG